MRARPKLSPVTQKVLFLLLKVAAFAGLFYILVLSFPNVPNGFFTDEASIGLTAWEFAHFDFHNFRLPFFYLHLDSYLLGALPPAFLAPMVKLFGLSEATVRMGSSLYAYIGLVVAYLTMRLLRFRFALIAVFILLITPFFFHLSRIQFGQSQGFLLVQVSIFLYYYLTTKGFKKVIGYAGVGVLAAFGCYGYTSYLLLIPLFLATWMYVEILNATDKLFVAKKILVILLSFCFVYLGVFYAAFKYPEFFKRFREKYQPSSHVSLIQQLSQNYPKYFKASYLFSTGEITQPGAFITRHSVTDSGIVYYLYLPFLFCSVVGILIRYKRGKRSLKLNIATTGIAWIFFSPFADLITTTPENPPYTVSLYAVSFGLVYALALGLDTLLHTIPHLIAYRKEMVRIVLLVITILTLQVEVVGFLRDYSQYPMKSSDYWGWQWGIRPILEFYQSQQGRYDDLYIEGIFNDPTPFISFYNIANHAPCPNCHFGLLDRLDLSRKQLFAISTNTYLNIPNPLEYKVVKLLTYPDGTEAFYIISHL